jgi:hypothetical protein
MLIRFALSLIALSCVYIPVYAQSTLPEGEGRDIVEDVCIACHGLINITNSRRSETQWQHTVSQMIVLGAPLAEYEVDIVVEYLSKNFGKEVKPSGE